MSGLVVLMTLVAGMGAMAGPIVGAFLVIALENRLGESVGMVTGLILIICVLVFRRGIVGELGALLERGRRAGV